MGLCRDNATNYLAQLGFSVVRIPRENIHPLDLIGRDRDQMKLGTLDQLVKNPAGSLPAITRDQQATNISGQTSSKLKLGIGINILGNVLGALAGTKLGIDLAYKNARTIQFEFKDVRSDSILPLTVGEYLRGVDIDVGNPVLDRYVMGKGHLFLITETIKSKSITVKAEKSDDTALSLDVPVVKEVVGGKVEVETSKAASGIVTYSGDKELTFGFKCFRVGIEDGVLALSPAAPNEIALAATAGPVDNILGAGLVDLEPGNLVS